jgi:hypothetical protein
VGFGVGTPVKKISGVFSTTSSSHLHALISNSLQIKLLTDLNIKT